MFVAGSLLVQPVIYWQYQQETNMSLIAFLACLPDGLGGRVVPVLPIV